MTIKLINYFKIIVVFYSVLVSYMVEMEAGNWSNIVLSQLLKYAATIFTFSTTHVCQKIGSVVLNHFPIRESCPTLNSHSVCKIKERP